MLNEWELRALLAISQVLLGGGLVLGLGRVAVDFAKRPATRERLGTWSIRVAVVLPILVVLPSWWTLPWPSARALSPVQPPSVAIEFVPSDHFAIEDDQHGEIVPMPDWSQLDETSPSTVWIESDTASVVHDREPMVLASGGEPNHPPAVSGWPEWLVGLIAVYSLLAGYFLAEFILGHLALWRLQRGSRSSPERVQTIAREVAPSRLQIRIHDQVTSPICFGVATPTILLPTPLAHRGNAQELRWILAHEADHLKRGDPLTGWLAGLARALFFFCPWFWTLRRELTLAQEQLADAAAIQAGGQPIEYAEFLMQLSHGASPSSRRQPLPAHGVQAGRSQLFRRIDMVLAENAKDGQTQARRWGWLLAGGLLAVALIVSGWSLAAADEPKAKTIIIEARAEADAEGKPKVLVVEGKPADEVKNVTMTVIKDPNQAEKVAEVKAKIATAMKAGKTEEALKLIDELEKLLAPKVMTFEGRVKPLPPMPPTPPMAPGVPTKPAAPMLPGKASDGENRNFLYFSDSAKSAIDGMRKQLSQTADAEAKKAIEAAIELLEKVKPLNRPLELKPGQLDLELHRERLARVYQGSGLPEARLGLSVSEVPEVLADQLNIERAGALIVAVKPGSIGAEAGLRVHDIITKVGQATIKNDKALFVELSKLSAGTPVEIMLLRKGKPVKVTITTPKPKAVLDRSAGMLLAPKVRFDSLQVQINGENFQMSAIKADASYFVVGKLNNGQPVDLTIEVKQGEKTFKTTTPEELPEPHAAAVKSLLSNVQGK